jgi:hypothetical protein
VCKKHGGYVLFAIQRGLMNKMPVRESRDSFVKPDSNCLKLIMRSQIRSSSLQNMLQLIYDALVFQTNEIQLSTRAYQILN